ncbi:ricin B-like lectin R40G3 [Silene latifolia]|uniref:ricin B-like lectin R40G3 n=1 Tax=Silene latifolia TaxID=37657 RepID=UPI003D78020E
MDSSLGHVGRHRHENRRHDYDDDDDNNNYEQPPPPPHFNNPYPPPPHQTYPPPSYDGGAYEQQPSYGGGYDAPPPEHSYDNQYYPSSENEPPTDHHRFRPHMPNFIGSHFHHGSDDHGGSTYGGGGDDGPELGSLENKPSHKIYCKAGGERYAVGIRDGKVVLTHPDTSDLTQHWCKDERYSTKVKDKDGYPSFILVNKGTGQAVKHSISCHPVQLAPYNPGELDESVLWTEGKDMGHGFRTIRTINNVKLVMDAWNADKDHGGIHDGTLIALYETWKGDNQNQQWKITLH